MSRRGSLLLFALALCAASACSSWDESGIGPMAIEGGPGAREGGVIDAPDPMPSPDPGISADDGSDFGATETDEEPAYLRGSACAEARSESFTDTNGDGLGNCEDLLVSCGPVRSCCVGDARCCMGLDVPPVPSLSFTGCTGDVLACVGRSDVTRFGPAGPWVVSDVTAGTWLQPGGDASYDGGLVVGSPVDLRSHRVRLQTTFAPPDGCAADCLESVGIALTTQTGLGSASIVRPHVGLLYSGTRHLVSLVIADDVVDSWPLTTERAWTLEVAPDGAVTVTGSSDGDPVTAAHAFMPVPGAQLVIYGRNANRSGTGTRGASIDGISVTTTLCDMPSAWTRRDPLTLHDRTTATDHNSPRVAAPSIADGTDSMGLPVTGLAFADVYGDHSVILVAGRSDPDTRFVLTTTPANPAVSPGRPHDMGGVGDPELVADATGSGWRLYYTATSTTGVRTIGLATATTLAGPWTAEAIPVISPDGTAAAGYEMPTVAEAAMGVEVMVVRAITANGERELVPFVFRDSAWHRHNGGQLPTLTHRPSEDQLSGFDADEIADPSLIVHNGAFHLYYAGRRGTRWGIGLIASDEIVEWRSAADGPQVLAGDGSGFDRVGLAGPDAVSRDTDIELVYQGSDGSRAGLGLAQRESANWRRPMP